MFERLCCDVGALGGGVSVSGRAVLSEHWTIAKEVVLQKSVPMMTVQRVRVCIVELWHTNACRSVCMRCAKTQSCAGV